MPSPTKKRGRKATGRLASVILFSRIKPRLAEALERYIASLRPAPGRTAVIETALEDFLTGRGFTPEKEGGS